MTNHPRCPFILDYVSCSPFRVPVARLAAAQAAIALGSRPRSGSVSKGGRKPKRIALAQLRSRTKQRIKSKTASRIVRPTAKARNKPPKTRVLVTV